MSAASCFGVAPRQFSVASTEQIEENLRELADTVPHAHTIQLLSANPLALSYAKMVPILEKINEYLPEIEHIYAAGRVSDLCNKTVEQLRALKELGMDEVSLGVESGDDWTLARVDKGYTSDDILEQCSKRCCFSWKTWSATAPLSRITR